MLGIIYIYFSTAENELRHAGVTQPIFTPDAIEAIAELSRGMPQKVNSLAEKALIIGYQKEAKEISAEVVELAQEEIELVQR